MAGQGLLRPALRGALAAALLWGVGACDEGSVLAPGGDDPCAAEPPWLAVGTTVQGRLDADGDCRSDDGRLYDAFVVELDGSGALAVTLTTEGYRPFLPFYDRSDTLQLSGWASDAEPTLTREHLFPAGSYLLRASSFERPGAPGAAPAEGGYTLSTELRPVPQEGCGRETSVTYGSVARGRLTPDDCLAVREPEPAEPRRGDGYDLLLRPGVPVEVTATADAPFRLAVWANGQPLQLFPAVPPGEERRVRAEGVGFLSVYLLEEEEGTGGSYTVTFAEAPPGGAAAVVPATPVVPAAPLRIPAPAGPAGAALPPPGAPWATTAPAALPRTR